MIKKDRDKTIEELSYASKAPLEHMFKTMKFVLQSGASRQEHNRKEIHTTTKTVKFAANKTTNSCTIY